MINNPIKYIGTCATKTIFQTYMGNISSDEIKSINYAIYRKLHSFLKPVSHQTLSDIVNSFIVYEDHEEIGLIDEITDTILTISHGGLLEYLVPIHEPPITSDPYDQTYISRIYKMLFG